MSELLKEKFFPRNLYKILYYLSRQQTRDNKIIVGNIKKNFENEISYPIINQTLNLLRIENLIKKKKGEDRREHIIELTEKGNQLLEILEKFNDFF
ncbi:MAG: hypothetical protein GF329_15175 [Candidatus Lokiarchaeota archaeon]|nr:hypothetical protein [Candidatus Lokiarchaeota archaeon]